MPQTILLLQCDIITYRATQVQIGRNTVNKHSQLASNNLIRSQHYNKYGISFLSISSFFLLNFFFPRLFFVEVTLLSQPRSQTQTLQLDPLMHYAHEQSLYVTQCHSGFLCLSHLVLSSYLFKLHGHTDNLTPFAIRSSNLCKLFNQYYRYFLSIMKFVEFF